MRPGSAGVRAFVSARGAQRANTGGSSQWFSCGCTEEAWSGTYRRVQGTESGRQQRKGSNFLAASLVQSVLEDYSYFKFNNLNILKQFSGTDFKVILLLRCSQRALWLCLYSVTRYFFLQMHAVTPGRPGKGTDFPCPFFWSSQCL